MSWRNGEIDRAPIRRSYWERDDTDRLPLQACLAVILCGIVACWGAIAGVAYYISHAIGR